MGGWSDKTKLIIISTLVVIVVEVEVELRNIQHRRVKLILLKKLQDLFSKLVLVRAKDGWIRVQILYIK